MIGTPLAGIRVLDLTRLLPGPFLSQVLADLGADVVKLEEPGTGDYTRWIPPVLDGAGYAFAATNRSKRSVAVDLKNPEGLEVAKRLAARADVLLESFRPGVLERLGLGDAVLEALNPRLVRCSLVGYGPGPYRDDVGHDLNYQSVAGILGLGAAPTPPPTQVADLGGALYAATGVLAALVERGRTGRGRRLEVALADAALAFNVLPLARAAAGDDPAAPNAWELTGGVPCYRLYRCADGRHVALAALEEKFWQRFAQVAGVDESLQLDRSAAAHAQVEQAFAQRDAAEWVALLRKAGVPATPVLAPAEVDDPRFGTRIGPASPLTQRASEGHVPALGEHTDAVLLEAGYSADEVARLRERRAIA